MSENDSQIGIPVALLSQALLELREARGNFQATREAVIRYFKNGIASGFQVGPLLQWLVFWPNNRESVFSQVGYSSKERREFLEILKEKRPVRELGLNDIPKDANRPLQATARLRRCAIRDALGGPCLSSIVRPNDDSTRRGVASSSTRDFVFG
jgi:hypothetical protein